MLEMRAIARDQGTDDKAARKKLGDCIEKYFELGKREEGATDAIERQAIREASADDPNP